MPNKCDGFSAREPASYRIHAYARRRVLEVAGEIDLSNAHLLVAAFTGELRFCRDGGMLIVDFGGVGFFDSFGLSALLRCSLAARSVDADWQIIAPVAVTRMLRLAGVDPCTLPLICLVTDRGRRRFGPPAVAGRPP
ncbi:MAG TPA: STAS domain-containing protein [Actinospica sp.]|nr:STAS domain-containing protein [Actinospica sp.]